MTEQNPQRSSLIENNGLCLQWNAQSTTPYKWLVQESIGPASLLSFSSEKSHEAQ